MRERKKLYIHRRPPHPYTALRYFNHASHRWDPLVETTTVVVSIGKDMKSGLNTTIVKLKKPLHVNLTHALLRLLAQDKLLTDHVTSASKLLAPYRVRNYCGEKVTAVFSRSTGSPFETTLRHEQEIPLDFRIISGGIKRNSVVDGLIKGKDNAKTRNKIKMSTQGVNSHTLSLSITIDGWVYQSVNAVPMDNVGLHTIRLQAMSFGEEVYEGHVSSFISHPSISNQTSNR